MANTIQIIAEGKDHASGPLSGIQGALGGIGTVMAGILGADLLRRFADGIKSLMSNSFEATARVQDMTVGLEGLMARELSRGKAVEETSTTVVGLTQKEQDELAKLTDRYADLQDKIDLATQKTKEYTSKTKESTKMADANKLADYNAELKTTAKRMDELQAATGRTATATKTVYEGASTIKDVFPAAQTAAREMMKELEDLAIKSPYRFQDITQTFKSAMAFGFNAQDAKKFTDAILSMAAGIGADNSMLQRMAYNLSQVRLAGKVTARDIRELALAGLDLLDVLKFMGKEHGVVIESTDDFNAAMESGKLKWEDFATDFQKYADTNFGGAAARMAGTINGLKSTFADVFDLTIPKILGPAAEKITGFIGKVLDAALKLRDSGYLEVWGQKAADALTPVIEPLDKIVTLLGKQWDAQALLNQQGLPWQMRAEAELQVQATNKELDLTVEALKKVLAVEVENIWAKMWGEPGKWAADKKRMDEENARFFGGINATIASINASIARGMPAAVLTAGIMGQIARGTGPIDATEIEKFALVNEGAAKAASGGWAAASIDTGTTMKKIEADLGNLGQRFTSWREDVAMDWTILTGNIRLAQFNMSVDWTAFWERFSTVTTAMWTWTIEGHRLFWLDMQKKAKEKLSEMEKAWEGFKDKVLGFLGDLGKDAKTKWAEMMEEAGKAGKGIRDNLWLPIVEAGLWIKTKLGEILETIRGWYNEIVGKIAEVLRLIGVLPKAPEPPPPTPPSDPQGVGLSPTPRSWGLGAPPMALAGASAGGGGINITMYNSVRNDGDIEMIAYRVAEVLRWRSGR